MDVHQIKDFKGGWFIGDFNPAVFKNPFFEVGHQHHKKGTIGQRHTHKVTTELTYIVSGSMNVNDHKLQQERHFTDGFMFIYHPNEISEVTFLEDTDLIVVRWPSVPSDKYMVD